MYQWKIYISIADECIFIDNSGSPYEIIAEGNTKKETISNQHQWKMLTNDYATYWIMENRDKILKGLEQAYKKLIAFKKYKKTPMVIGKDGKVIEIPYQKIKAGTGTIYT